MTFGQQKEFDILKWFCPDCANAPEKEIQEYFDWSERGKQISENNRLMWARVWRGRTIHELWEQGILEGSVPYSVLLGGFENNKKWWQFWKSPHKPIPRDILEVMKKEMFGGMDSKLIEDIYNRMFKK